MSNESKATNSIDALEQLKLALAKSAFTNHMNAVPTLCADGKAEMEMNVTDDMKQHLNVVHGAVLSFVADSVCCWSAVTELGNVVTSELKINFLRPAMGEKIIGKGYIKGATRKSAVTVADVYIQKRGKLVLVATALATIVAV